MNDLDSKSSSSSEGFHFEIKEARKRSKKQDKNASKAENLQIDTEIRDPVIDQGALAKNKDLEMRLQEGFIDVH